MAETNGVSEPSPKTLLLVDDEANILTALRRLFRPQGYRVLTAESGPAGLEILAGEPVDLVISDMRMPQMSGAEFLEQVADRWPQTVRFLLTGYADLDSTVDAINKGRIYGYFAKPWEDNDIRIAVRNALHTKHVEEERARLEALTQQQNAELRELNATLEQKVQARTEELRQTNLFLELAYEQLEESYFAAIPIFANLIEMREGPDGGHSRRVGELAQAVAVRLGLGEADVREVYFAGLLHEIGMLALPDHLLRKPYADLNTTERKLVDRHPVTGQAVLMGLEPLQQTALYIRHHHERPDGRGYPDRLTGTNIPLGARIVAAASDFDTLRDGRLLGKKLPAAQARGFLEQRRGNRYDGAVLDALFTELDGKVEAGAYGEEGIAVPTHMLEPGMVLAHDLRNREGVLLLTRGYRLTEPLIAKLIAYARDQKESFTLQVRPTQQESSDGKPASHHAG